MMDEMLTIATLSPQLPFGSTLFDSNALYRRPPNTIGSQTEMLNLRPSPLTGRPFDMIIFFVDRFFDRIPNLPTSTCVPQSAKDCMPPTDVRHLYSGLSDTHQQPS